MPFKDFIRSLAGGRPSVPPAPAGEGSPAAGAGPRSRRAEQVRSPERARSASTGNGASRSPDTFERRGRTSFPLRADDPPGQRQRVPTNRRAQAAGAASKGELVEVNINSACLGNPLVVGLTGLEQPRPQADASSPAPARDEGQRLTRPPVEFLKDMRNQVGLRLRLFMLFIGFGRVLGPARRARWNRPSYGPEGDDLLIAIKVAPAELSLAGLTLFDMLGSRDADVPAYLAKKTTEPAVHDRAVLLLRKIGSSEAYDELNELAGSNIPGLAAKARVALKRGPLVA